MAPVMEGKSIGWEQKNSAKRRAPDLKNQESARDQGTLVQLKDSICFKSVQIGS
jgi:hypothetical protein